MSSTSTATVPDSVSDLTAETVIQERSSQPFYDSLLVKITAYGRTFEDTRKKAVRALTETKIDGVKTNIGFLLNVLNHPTFIEGKCDTGFIAANPELRRHQQR